MTKTSPQTPLNTAQKAALALIRGYQWLLSPLMGNGCRFSPTCSDYAAQAIMTYGALKGGGLALRRIARCHPWSGPGGIDPVP